MTLVKASKRLKLVGKRLFSKIDLMAVNLMSFRSNLLRQRSRLRKLKQDPMALKNPKLLAMSPLRIREHLVAANSRGILHIKKTCRNRRSPRLNLGWRTFTRHTYLQSGMACLHLQRMCTADCLINIHKWAPLHCQRVPALVKCLSYRQIVLLVRQSYSHHLLVCSVHLVPLLVLWML